MKLEFTYKRFFLMFKVMGRYIIDTIFPDKLALFTPYGHNIQDDQKGYDWWQSPNLLFWQSFGVLGIAFFGGMFINPVGTLWFFTVIALHSQWRMTGQFYAQRYIYCALPGFCVVAGILLQPHPVLVAIVATFYFIRAFIFIPVFASNEHLSLNDLDTFPNFPQAMNSLSQYYLNYPYPKGVNMPGWRVNQIGYLLFRAEELEPESWSIKMNVACFFALVQQWPMCLQKTTEALDLVRPLGGVTQPVTILEQQVKNVTALMQQIQQQQQMGQAPTGAIVSPGPTPTGEKEGTTNG
jgi:hypothetical protein